MKKVLAFLSFQGRANRTRYWLTILAILAATFACVIVGSATMTVLPPVAWVSLFLLLLLFVAGLANGARRLHDRGKSAWWLLVFVGIPTLLSTLSRLIGLIEDADGPSGLVALIGLGFSIWALVELGFLKGVAGPNRYGEDSLDQPGETDLGLTA